MFASRGELRFARFELGARFGYLLATLRDLLTGRCNLDRKSTRLNSSH